MTKDNKENTPKKVSHPLAQRLDSLETRVDLIQWKGWVVVRFDRHSAATWWQVVACTSTVRKFTNRSMSKESLSNEDNDGLFKQLKLGLNEEQCKKVLDQTCKQQVTDKVDDVEENTSLVQSDGGSEDFPLHDPKEITYFYIHVERSGMSSKQSWWIQRKLINTFFSIMWE